MLDLGGAEVEGPALPAEHLEDRIAGEEILDTTHLLAVQPAALDHRTREGARRRAALRRDRRGALAGQQPAANEHLAEGIGIGRTPHRQRRRHDGALIEGDVDTHLIALQLEDAGLALLADQLKDVGNAEIAKVAAETDTHG